MEYITKSLNAMIWLAVGATAYALGCLFQLLAAVDQQTNTTFTNVAAWEHGSAWLQFIGALIITAGVCVAARERPGEALPLALGAALYTAGLAVVAVSGMTTGMRASLAPETAKDALRRGVRRRGVRGRLDPVQDLRIWVRARVPPGGAGSSSGPRRRRR